METNLLISAQKFGNSEKDLLSQRTCRREICAFNSIVLTFKIFRHDLHCAIFRFLGLLQTPTLFIEIQADHPKLNCLLQLLCWTSSR